MIRIAIAGAAGRMGRALLEETIGHSNYEVIALVRPGSPRVQQTETIHSRAITFKERLESACDVLIDFTVGGTQDWVRACVERRLPMVIGSTGHTGETLDSIRAASMSIPMFMASNFSPGIHVLMGLLRAVRERLGKDYDIEVVETHHRHKRDAPSGTAAAIMAELSRPVCEGESDTGIRSTGVREGTSPIKPVAVHSLRMGDVVGQHEIHYSGCGETLTLRHSAHSRTTFALGALRAAQWIIAQPPGLYSMMHVWGGTRESD